MGAFSDSVERQWYTKPHWLLLFAPLSALFILLAYLRRRHYSDSLLCKVPVPVVVIGNITVGGTGKTPVIVALAAYFSSKGYRPGIITRGYGVDLKCSTLIFPHDKPENVGDEPLFLAEETACPVVVGPDRAESARLLVSNGSCDIILSDDGLQHYPLYRDIEIAVVDSQRQLGNGWRLPVGPLRESKTRLQEVDFVLVNGEALSAFWLPKESTFVIAMQPKAWRNVKTGKVAGLGELDIQSAKAIAGIGNPQRFFNSLVGLGFSGGCQAFPDHHPYTESDFETVEGVLLMTEKDAVKCRPFAKDNWWALSIELSIDEAFLNRLNKKVESIVAVNDGVK